MLNYKISTAVILLSYLAITGCAPRAASIAPVFIPSANYKDLSCEETKTTLAQKIAQQNALASSQNSAATGDTVGVILILLPVGTMFGERKEGELAQAKGEVIALQGAVSANCRPKPEPVHAGGKFLPVKDGVLLPAPDPFCAVPPCYRAPSMEQRLNYLKSLYDKKLITTEEYKIKQQQIMKDF